MVFPPVPLYLDPPTSWNQQHQLVHQQQPVGGAGGGNGDPLQQQSQLQPVPAQPPPLPDGSGGSGGGMGSIRPNSMADRARLAKIPQPEQALKCPRCDSTNTKFCYFNNYSLTQPRHFCKTCRRYWTRGGALRNVPVGGGCRRNKRSSKSSGTGASSSKSPSSAAAIAAAENRSSASATSAGTSSLPSAPPPPPSQLPFLGSMHPMMDYNIGLGFSGMQQSIDHDNSMGGLQEQWRLQSQIQQFPFFGGLESHLPTSAAMPGVYPFDGQGGGGATGATTGLELINQLASAKMEDNNPRGLNLARQYLGVSPRNDQFWAAAAGGGGGEGSSAGGAGGNNGGGGGGGWMTNLSGFNSSSTGSLL